MKIILINVFSLHRNFFSNFESHYSVVEEIISVSGFKLNNDFFMVKLIKLKVLFKIKPKLIQTPLTIFSFFEFCQNFNFIVYLIQIMFWSPNSNFLLDHLLDL